jgi:hypothetical protein
MPSVVFCTRPSVAFNTDVARPSLGASIRTAQLAGTMINVCGEMSTDV